MARSTKGKSNSGWKILVSWTVALVVLALTTVMLAVWNLPALSDWQSAHHRMEAARAKVDREKAQIAQLETEKQALAVDHRALERAAREEYLLLRPGEEVYVFQERRTRWP